MGTRTISVLRKKDEIQPRRLSFDSFVEKMGIDGRTRIAIAFRHSGNPKSNQIIFDAGDRTLHTRITITFGATAYETFLAILKSCGVKPSIVTKFGRHFAKIDRFLGYIRHAMMKGEDINVSIRSRREEYFTLELSQRKLSLKKQWSNLGGSLVFSNRASEQMNFQE